MTTRLLLALALLSSAAACKIGGGTEESALSATCRPVNAVCGSNSDCCSYGCDMGRCIPNPVEGGLCRTSDDCLFGLCKGGSCSASATCRDDGDVCSGAYSCCSGNCAGAVWPAAGECQANHAPVSDVGLSVTGSTVPYKQPVPLRNGSYDPDAADTLYYEWSIVSAPPFSAATIAVPNSSSAQYVPQFVPDVVGPYILLVRIVDGPVGQPGRIPVVATVAFDAVDTSPIARPRAPGTVPVAIPGTVGHVPRRSSVALDGTASSDPDGDAIASWLWEIVSQPVGAEATLQNGTSTAATLVLPTAGAVEGDYVVRLSVQNAKGGSAEITIHADDTTPVARLTAPAEANALASITLDASTSSDADQDALSFAWQTTVKPPGSAAGAPTPLGGGATATFTPDLPGAYTFSVTVGDPAQHVHTVSRSVTVYKAVRDLGHRIVDAEYSRALDVLVAVGPHPDAVGHPGEGIVDLFDPTAVTQSPSSWIALPKVPTCVGLSPDGLFAIVGHSRAISYVDLTTRKVLATVTLNYDVSEAVLGDRRSYKGASTHFAHFLFAGATTNQPVQTLILNCTLDTAGVCGPTPAPELVVGTALNVVPPTSRLRIRPEPGGSVSRMFVAAYPHTSAGWWGYNIDSNTGATYALPSNFPLTGFYAGAWVADDGSLAFNENGRAYYGRTTLTTTELVEAGVLGGGTPVTVEAIDHSSPAGLVLAVDGVTQQTLSAYDDVNLGTAWSVTLPKWVAKAAGARGRFVFFDAAGTRRYAIVASTTGAETDAALVVYCPDATGVDACP